MKQNNIIASVVSILILSACQSIDHDSRSKWAEIDDRKIAKALKEIAVEQNKERMNILKTRYEVAQLKRNALSDLITDFKSDGEYTCPEEYSAENVVKQGSIFDIPRARLDSATIDEHITESGGLSDAVKKCLHQVHHIDSVRELKTRFDDLKNVMENKNQFEDQISKISERETNKIIKNYAYDKYDVILKTDHDNVVYSSSKIKIDITDSVIEYIENNEPDLVIKDFLEYSSPETHK